MGEGVQDGGDRPRGWDTPLRLVRLLTNIFDAVAQMAKIKRWRDVRLLSFDLQTVEFAYSSASHPRSCFSSTYL